MDPQVAGYRANEFQLEARRAEKEQNEYRARLYMEAMRGTPLEASAGGFSGLLAAGEDIKPSDVLGLQKAEAAARLKAAEDAARAAEQNRTHADVETQSRWQRERNAAIMAGHASMGGGGAPVDPKVLAGWESHKTHAKNDELIKNIATSNLAVKRAESELQSGNPQQEAQAIHTMAALSTSIGASGGRVTVAASRDIKEAYGLLDSALNKGYRALHGGRNMPHIVKLAQDAVKNLGAITQQAGNEAYQQFHRTAGMGSPFARDPGLHDIVKAEDDALRMQLNQPIQEDEYGDNGEASQPARKSKPAHGKPKGKIGGPEDPLLKKYGYQ